MDSAAEDKELRTTCSISEKGLAYFYDKNEQFVKKITSSTSSLIEILTGLENNLPTSAVALTNAESRLQGSYRRHATHIGEYLDFLDRSDVPDSNILYEKCSYEQNEMETRVNTVLSNIQSAKDEQCSVSSKQSAQSNVSSAESVKSVLAKAKSAKVKLDNLEKKQQLLKEQFQTSLQIEALELQTEAAAAEAEASVFLETQDNAEPPQEIAHQNIQEYLNGLEHQDSAIVSSLSPQAANFMPDQSKKHESPYTTTSMGNMFTNQQDLPVNQPSSNSVIAVSDGPCAPPQSVALQQPLPMVPNKHPDVTYLPTALATTPSYCDTSVLSIKRRIIMETLQQQKFDDRPDQYVVWKAQFKSSINELKCTLMEETTLLTNCTDTKSEAYKLIMSTRCSFATHPRKCLDTIWTRLDQRFGSPELLEATLKHRLSQFFGPIDREKLFDLHYLLIEIENIKNIPEYSLIFAYLDSSLGIKPIIEKLPRFIQDRWISCAVNYKAQHRVIFLPFSELVKFIGEISAIRNDPGLLYEQSKNKQSSTPQRKLISARKTEVSQEQKTCVFHKTSSHCTSNCRKLQRSSIDERKKLLKENNLCMRCCATTKQFASKCKESLKCEICQGTNHCTLLHNNKQSNQPTETSNHQSSNPTQSHGEEEKTPCPTVNTRCTEICNGFQGRSCARILPVLISSARDPNKILTTYAMLDDQSNRTLGSKEFFDFFNIQEKPINYTMEACSGKVKVKGRQAFGLTARGKKGNIALDLPEVLECRKIPDNTMEIPTPDIAKHFPHMADIARYLSNHDPSMKVTLLIGRDLPDAHHVLDQRIGPPGSPFAQRSPLGWTVIGDVCLSGRHIQDPRTFKLHVTSNGRPTTLEPCQNTIRTVVKKTHIQPDVFLTSEKDNEVGLSMEDRQFLKIMDKDFHLGEQGQWTAPLPFKSNSTSMPNNLELAVSRAKSLDASLQKNETKKQHFLTFMEKIFENHHAELAPDIPSSKPCWYLPLFGVYHPRKPDQIRGVFDSSAKFQNVSLNEQLLQGPDFINSLLGILIRFRKDMVAVVADVQQMFHSFLVEDHHRDFLRFLWHKDNQMDQPLVTYRMRVHVFGNRPSPAIAMYGLTKIGQLSENSHGHDVKEFITDNFYVDDGLTSCSATDEAISLLQRTQDAMKTYGNLRLHKFASNSVAVMKAFNTSDLAKGLIDIDLEKDFPTQRSLGMQWNLATDTFHFTVSEDDKPCTRRGILSTVNSLYDPLGFISPVTIAGKKFLRKVVTFGADWDDKLPSDLEKEWNDWKSKLPEVESIHIPRIIVPHLSDTTFRQLLVYCDASESAIAAVCYLNVRYTDDSESTGFVLGKTKLAPTSGHTIPRLELCAAVLAIEVAQIALEQLKMKIDSTKYFSDSKVVLGYINNDKKRFFVYVSNRISRIRSLSNPDQWFYVCTSQNPADVGTRGDIATNIKNCQWLTGPVKMPEYSQSAFDLVNPEMDKDVRANKLDILPKQGLDVKRFERFSSWNRLVNALAKLKTVIFKFKGIETPNPPTLHRNIEYLIIKSIQHETYYDEIRCLQKSKPLLTASPIASLDPFLDENEVLCVGGRIKSHTLIDTKQPVILPAKCHVTMLLVRKYHEETHHQGRHFTEGKIRSAGYWIVGAKRLIASIIHNCITCRKLRKPLLNQKMASLPKERTTPEQPPFTEIGVDIFGPWEILTRRTRGGARNSKRWAAIFTCLATRGVHIEVVEELSASSFINALRRFFAIRGEVKTIRSDRGTNFIGTASELDVNKINIEDGPIPSFLTQQRMTWIFNPPHSSHMGGIWERMIGITRRILEALLVQNKNTKLTHEVLTTFLAEASSIINSRPLVPVSSDPENPTILSPNMLLTQKVGFKMLMSEEPTKNYEKSLQNNWKRAQHLAAMFWKRWKVEYLNTLQRRSKWMKEQRNVTTCDVVLVHVKDAARSTWPLGIVTKTIPSDDNLVRKVALRMITNGQPKEYIRPIHELVLLCSE